MLFFRFIYVACRLPGPSERLLRDAYQCGRGWVGGGVGMGDSGGRESGNGWRILGTESGNWWRGNRGAGSGNSESAGIQNSRNSETGNGFGIDGCAQMCTESGNSAEFTPGNARKRPPETPRKPPN